jgi:HAE1 family hydrophobic/amphiphilic exporter-1/multidrug efflux pump
VVEAVEHHIEHGLSPVAATEKAMDEVSGPVVAIGLVLCAVFVPVSFMGGITGQLYKQFAITVSISVILSVIVALTLTPALCGMLLRPRKEIRGPVGYFLRGFNKVFNKTTQGYLSGVGFFPAASVTIGLACLAGLWFGAGRLPMKLPKGFVPNEDQGYFFNVLTLPDGASMERTDELMRRAEADLKSIPGVSEVLTTGGLNLLTNAYTSNNASVITMLKPWEERKSKEEQLGSILLAARRKFAAYPEAVSLVFPPPPINGLGNASGFVFELQDKVGRQPQELAAAKVKFMQAMAARPELTGLYSGFSTSVPQIKLDIDRDKVRTLNIPVNSVFQGLQIYLGGLRSTISICSGDHKVMLQAEQDRKSPESINDIYVRSSDNSMVLISTISTMSMTTGPTSCSI